MGSHWFLGPLSMLFSGFVAESNLFHKKKVLWSLLTCVIFLSPRSEKWKLKNTTLSGVQYWMFRTQTHCARFQVEEFFGLRSSAVMFRCIILHYCDRLLRSLSKSCCMVKFSSYPSFLTGSAHPVNRRFPRDGCHDNAYENHGRPLWHTWRVSAQAA